MKKKFTDTFVRSRKPAKAGTRYEVTDTEHPRLILRVTDRGAKSFCYVSRFPGSTNMTRRLIGTYPATTLTKARETARKWDALLVNGVDPAIEQKRIIEEEKRKAREETLAGTNVFEVRAREYLRQHCKHHRRAHETGRLIEKELMPLWRDRRIDQITTREIKALIGQIAERSPSTARSVLTVAKSFFSWALDLGHIETSPAASIKPQRLIGEKKPRTRVLSDDEIVKFWDASGTLGYPIGSLYRFLLLTGTRLREAANAPWTEFDLERRVWVVEPERFKSDIRHVVPLSDQAMQVIEELPRCGPYLFSFNGTSPVNNFSYLKRRLDALMGAPAWRTHDLRRVVRSKLASLKIPDTVAELVIGHGKRGQGRIYDQHTYEAELRDALQQWANKLRDLTTPPPPNVSNLSEEKKKRKRA